MTFGEMIKNKRLEMGLSVKDAAENIGIKFPDLYYLESDKAKPRVKSFTKIINYYGIDFDMAYDLVYRK